MKIDPDGPKSRARMAACTAADAGIESAWRDGRLGEPDAWRRLLVKKVRGAFPCGGARGGTTFAPHARPSPPKIPKPLKRAAWMADNRSGKKNRPGRDGAYGNAGNRDDGTRRLRRRGVPARRHGATEKKRLPLKAKIGIGVGCVLLVAGCCGVAVAMQPQPEAEQPAPRSTQPRRRSNARP